MQNSHANLEQGRLDILLKHQPPTSTKQVADARNPKCSAEGNPDLNKPTHWDPGEQKLTSWIKQNIGFLPAWRAYYASRRR